MEGKLKIVYKNISDLKHPEYNPRKITKAEMEKLKSSIREFGFQDPAIVNIHPGRENNIVGGNQRVSAALELGYVEVPTVEVDLDENREKLMNVALNRISGEWNEEKLSNLMYELSKNNADILLAGFADQELNVLLDRAMMGAGVDGEEIDPDRMQVLVADAPGSPRLKAQQGFFFDDINKFEKVKEFFGTGRDGRLDAEKLYEAAVKGS
jgi:ParB-like chromosome segregation protein Spo0J